MATTVHHLKITLLGTEPPIWRQVVVPSDLDLERLHWAIQLAFGWESSHLWDFRTETGRFGTGDGEGESVASATTVAAVVPKPGDQLLYTYDFGDGWEHGLEVVSVGDAEPSTAYPRCVDGQRAGPPEDSGGVWGYHDLLEILADPSHVEHPERLEWLGLDSASQFDPEGFDPDAVNPALARLGTR